MSTREQLERAKPTVDSPTYRRLTGKTNDQQYRKELEDERRRITRPDRQAADPR